MSFIANLVLLILSFLVLPERVAIHFGVGGDPNNWAPVYVHTLIMAGVNTLIFLSFYFTPHLIRLTPGQFISLPNKEYWLNDKNKSRTIDILSKEMYLFGIATFAFLFLVSLLALHANLAEPVRLREDLFWVSFVIYIGFTIYWSIRLISKFRLPKIELKE